MIAAGKAKRGDGKDVAHKNGNPVDNRQSEGGTGVQEQIFQANQDGSQGYQESVMAKKAGNVHIKRKRIRRPGRPRRPKQAVQAKELLRLGA